ncbi:DinB family protein [Chitinophaga nivalis]|uniref:DinB family protein n=1 Tax=Chitinophaga nivalis TaxID=2991709 RepID=A0ABT3IMA9_9BACT|nr:DinB family protein [Chitinophaga nivalis]MCW3465224.1 DinB family protein [Chitinophaga nivalis]MCW3485084.1 DinB family protein [Chitinophaga nivalis]
MKQTAWFNRKFPLIEDNGVFPSILERLAGTAARVEEIVRQLPPAILTRKRDEKWTIQEEIGHLSDMEPLWTGRFDDFINGATELTVADLTNRKTHEANHNATAITVLLQQFREQRAAMVSKLRGLEEVQLEKTALHPRLKTPMRVIDLAYFVAEHDDHHLAAIRVRMT